MDDEPNEKTLDDLLELSAHSIPSNKVVLVLTVEKTPDVWRWKINDILDGTALNLNLTLTKELIDKTYFG